MSNELLHAAPTLLYAEDAEDDFFFFDRAARASQIPLSIIWVRDGFEAQQFLSKPNYRMPTALITDLRMPGCDGYELLTWLKAHPCLRDLPVYVLSTSKLGSDKELCRKLGAKKYFEKPSSPKEYAKLLQEIARELNLTGLPAEM